MKTLLLLLSLLSVSVSQSQNIKATATKQDWASGISWTHGTIYGFSISGDADSLEKTELLYAIIDGHKFNFIETEIGYTWEREGKKFVSYRFDVIETRNPADVHDKQDDSPEYEGCYIKIGFENRQMKIPIDSVEELFYIAYP